jgi:hypothetical protein
MKRSSKFEVRNPKQIRNSKEFQNSDLLRDVSASVNIGVPGDKTVKTVVLSRGRAGTPLKRGVNESDWKCLIRFSDLFRVSNFGFRVLALAFIFLPLPAFTATNISTAGDDLPQLRPPRAEIPPSFWENYGVWVIAGCILLVALIGVAVWALTRPKPPIMIAPHIRAKQTLEPLLTKAENGLVLSQVSQVLRHYVIEAFGLPPGEQTTMEFCRLIATHEGLGPELSGAISEFLRRCDDRKFTPSPPAEPMGAAATALKFIDTAEARLAELRRRAEQVSAA